ncbi:MAG: restriction endonuclease [Limisphaerales bacterium]
MSQRNEKFGDLLLMAPWWVSAGLGVLAYVGLRWILPAFAGQDKLVQAVFAGLPTLAPFAALVFGIMAVASALFGAKRRRLVDEQRSLDTLRATPWKDFEYLVAEAYRRRGFTVDYSLSKGSDGGVDLILQRDGRRSLVQCKQWKVFSVGRPVLQQMFGIVTAEGADEAIIVTSGQFTDEARAFARGKPMQLVDGPSLLELVTSVQAGRENVSKAEPDPVPASVAPRCPRCGKEMILRTARRGSQAGSTFWGCPSFPACKGTLPA